MILTPPHCGVPPGVGVYGVHRKMRAKGLALEIKEASLGPHVFCLQASLVTSVSTVLPNFLTGLSGGWDNSLPR